MRILAFIAGLLWVLGAQGQNTRDTQPQQWRDLQREMLEMQREMLERFRSDAWMNPFSFSFPEMSDSLFTFDGSAVDTLIELPGGGTLQFRSFGNGNGFSQQFFFGPRDGGEPTEPDELPEERYRRQQQPAEQNKKPKPKLETIRI